MLGGEEAFGPTVEEGLFPSGWLEVGNDREGSHSGWLPS